MTQSTSTDVIMYILSQSIISSQQWMIDKSVDQFSIQNIGSELYLTPGQSTSNSNIKTLTLSSTPYLFNFQNYPVSLTASLQTIIVDQNNYFIGVSNVNIDPDIKSGVTMVLYSPNHSQLNNQLIILLSSNS